jgi:hypothetical protein
MLAGSRRPAFYAVGRGWAGDVIALLHPPYTVWHLSYFALGAAVAPHIYPYRLEWGLAAFALAVGVAAHALDELHGRPLRTHISGRALKVAAALALAGALAIGLGGVLWVSPWLAPLVAVGGLLVPAYNLELARGRVHGDAWFALAWGGFPAFTGYFVNALHVGLAGLAMAAGCTALSVAQRRLSSAARELRRRTASVTGTRTRSDGSSEPITLALMLGPLDGALAALSATTVLLAVALLLARL